MELRISPKVEVAAARSCGRCRELWKGGWFLVLGDWQMESPHSLGVPLAIIQVLELLP